MNPEKPNYIVPVVNCKSKESNYENYSAKEIAQVFNKAMKAGYNRVVFESKTYFNASGVAEGGGSWFIFTKED